MVCVLVSITSSAVRLKICEITAGNKKYNLIIEKQKKNHDKILLLGKTKLNTNEILISKTLIDSHISYEQFVSVNNVLKKYNEMKEKLKNPGTYEINGIDTIVDNVEHCGYMKNGEKKN